MASVEDILKRLEEKAKPENVEGMARYGISSAGRLGVSVPDMRKLAKEIGMDHELALKLWETGIQEARIVAAMIDAPQELTESQMEAWAKDLDSWDVCDQVCMNLFEKSPLAWKKIDDWSQREEEFVKRAAYALLACLAWHDKGAEDSQFTAMFPVVIRGATDGRNYVKKAVSWALRNIGKRNLALNAAAIEAAKEVQQIDSKPARWVAAQVLRELESQAVQDRLRK